MRPLSWRSSRSWSEAAHFERLHWSEWEFPRKWSVTGGGERSWIECRWNEQEIQGKFGGLTAIRAIAHTCVPRFLVFEVIELVVNKERKLKLQSETQLGRAYILYTGRAPAARPVDWRRGFFFPGTVTFTPTCIRPLSSYKYMLVFRIMHLKFLCCQQTVRCCYVKKKWFASLYYICSFVKLYIYLVYPII